MQVNTEINRVSIVGAGLIGSSWAACFLAHGLDVVATDPAPGAEDRMRHNVNLQKKIMDGVLEEVDGRSFEALSRERDNLIMGLLELLSHRAKAEPVAASGHTADRWQSMSYLTDDWD